MQIEAAVYTSGAEMMAAYADRRRRLMGTCAPKRARPIGFAQRAVIASSSASLPPQPPLWLTQEIWFDYHILAFKALTSPYWHMTMMCVTAGKTVAALTGNGRMADIVLLRFKVAYTLKVKFNISYSAIGRLMGSDHTSARYWVHRYCEAQRLPIPLIETVISNFDADKARDMFAAGHSINEIADVLDVGRETVRSRGRTDGWYVTPQEANYRKLVESADINQIRDYAKSGLKATTIALKVQAPVSAVERYLEEFKIAIATLPGRKRGGG